MARSESLADLAPPAPEDAAWDMPGYRRRVRVVPQPGAVLAMLEDDIHAMAVRLRHAGGIVAVVEPLLDRMPWTTCPGAAAKLVETFTGVPLADVTQRLARKANCTHLHDLAILGAAHAGDARETRFDIAVSDPVDGVRELALRKDGAPLLHWREEGGVLVSPAALAARSLLALRDAVAALPGAQAEAARLLQWAGLVAHGRTIPMERQSDASRMPANCYTFQPERAAVARRIGAVINFSSKECEPGETFARHLGLATVKASDR